jgi:hypothetical protein
MPACLLVTTHFRKYDFQIVNAIFSLTLIGQPPSVANHYTPMAIYYWEIYRHIKTAIAFLSYEHPHTANLSGIADHAVHIDLFSC